MLFAFLDRINKYFFRRIIFMKKQIKATEAIFPMPVLLISTFNEDGTVDIDALEAIAFDPYTHGYYKVGTRVADAFKEGLKLK